MIEHYNKLKCPFKVGDLVYSRYDKRFFAKMTFYLVLDIQWGSYYHHDESCWVAHVLHQQTGKKDWEPSASFEPAGKNDENK